MPQIWVRRGEHKLAELVKIEHSVLRAVVLSHDVFGVADAWIQQLLVHEVVEFVAGQLPIPVRVNGVEKLHKTGRIQQRFQVKTYWTTYPDG